MIDCTQGHGIEGRFGGLPDEFSRIESSKIAIVPVAFDKTTTYGKGTDLGPAALIEASRNLELYDIETNTEVFRRGIYTAPAIQEENSKEMLQRVYEEVGALMDRGLFVATLGGEHSISYAPVRAHADLLGPISVLQFDAHADLAAAYEGNPWSHASAMARVKEIEGVERLVAVGIRSMSQSEVEFLEQENTFFAHELFEGDAWMDRVVERLTDKVYITFDLDAFDSSLMPATGTPEPGGIFWHQAMKLLRKVAKKRTIVGLDIVELCPLQGFKAPEFLAAKLLYKLLSFTFEGKQ